ncbi:MAG: glycosyl hydrolase [Weeksellaceae bacterium]
MTEKFTRRQALPLIVGLPVAGYVALHGGTYINTEIQENLLEGPMPYTREILTPGCITTGISPPLDDIDTIEDPDLFNIVNLFPDWFDIWANHENITKTLEHGHQLMLSIRTQNHEPARGYNLKNLLDDKMHIAQNAQALAKLNVPIYLRFNYEMNADWFEHGPKFNSPKDFVNSWNTFADIVLTIAPNVKMVFCVNAGMPVERYAPDPQFVHYTAVDTYNKHPEIIVDPRIIHTDSSFSALCGPTVRKLQDTFTQTPIMITEVGIEQGKESLPWMLEAAQTAASWEGISAFMPFAWNKYKFMSFDEANWLEVMSGDNLKGFGEYIRSEQAFATLH